MEYSIEKIHNKAKNIFKEADSIFRKGFFGNVEIFQQKGTQLSTTVVTKTDKDIDVLLRKKLSTAFPEIGFISEEIDENMSREDYNWIIDPIDGTSNFAHKIPICGISIGLWKEDEPIYGIISFPILRETVYAIKGKGTYLNDEQVIRKKSKKFSEPFVVYSHVGTNEEKLRVFKKIAEVIPLPQDFLSAAFHIVLAGLRRADCSISVNLPIWDIAAGLIIAKETGLHIEYVSKPPGIFRSDLREYKNTFVVAEKDLAIKVAKQIKLVF